MRPDHSDNPYKGPFPFEKGDPLYGRDTESLELLNRLLGSRVVLLYSVSGAGKTSLLQAGLIPALESRNFVPFPVIRVGEEPPLGYKGNRYLLSTIQSLEPRGPTGHSSTVEHAGGPACRAIWQVARACWRATTGAC